MGHDGLPGGGTTGAAGGGSAASWADIQEDEMGNLRAASHMAAEQRAARARLLSAASSGRIRKGMIRYVQLVLDLSSAAGIQDMRPSRLALLLALARQYIAEFFDQNPLGQMGVILMRNGVAERLTELSGSPESQIKKLETGFDAGGAASLQNALEVALGPLRGVPPYGQREVHILMAALSTCDPGSIADTIKTCKEQRVRVSIVGISAEVFLCRRIAEETGGSYGVALHEAHAERLLLGLAPPPPTSAAFAGSDLVQMGFPRRDAEDAAAVCHVGAEAALHAGAYTCPKCAAKVKELPAACHVCGLTLISSPHLARSYHHLFPVPAYVEVAPADLQRAAEAANGATSSGRGGCDGGSAPCCYGCLAPLVAATGADAGLIVRCPNCTQLFCFDCDVFVHEHLHNCPGCECRTGQGASDAQGGSAAAMDIG